MSIGARSRQAVYPDTREKVLSQLGLDVAIGAGSLFTCQEAASPLIDLSYAASLVRSAAVGGWTEGASSTATAAGDCSVEWTVISLTWASLAGLSESDPDTNYATIKYGMYFAGGGTVGVYEEGVNKGDFGAIALGDRMAVRRTGTTITYEKNGAVLYTSLTTSGNPLLVDVSLHTASSAIRGIRFFSAGVLIPIVWTNIVTCTATDNEFKMASIGTPTYAEVMNGRKGCKATSAADYFSCGPRLLPSGKSFVFGVVACFNDWSSYAFGMRLAAAPAPYGMAQIYLPNNLIAAYIADNTPFTVFVGFASGPTKDTKPYGALAQVDLAAGLARVAFGRNGTISTVWSGSIAAWLGMGVTGTARLGGNAGNARVDWAFLAEGTQAEGANVIADTIRRMGV